MGRGVGWGAHSGKRVPFRHTCPAQCTQCHGIRRTHQQRTSNTSPLRSSPPVPIKYPSFRVMFHAQDWLRKVGWEVAAESCAADVAAGLVEMTQRRKLQQKPRVTHPWLSSTHHHHCPHVSLFIMCMTRFDVYGSSRLPAARRERISLRTANVCLLCSTNTSNRDIRSLQRPNTKVARASGPP